ncbi:MAG TPA: twin-arginine translocation pathway signal protein, partial [Thermodesulfobacteriota bacterium]|nr:twin-arginine translocation pathway signal protein [Thermodesulfobacteriota bacterium]
AVLTWPEGNGWIVRRIEEKLQAQIRTGALVFGIRNEGKGVCVDVYSARENASYRIRAERAVYACPRVFARRLIAEEASAALFLQEFQYAPWLVANLTLKSLPAENRGMPPAWDNVIYESPSLGYVVATHQSLASRIRETVFTYYYAMAASPPEEERARLVRTPWREWAEFIVRDLSRPHPEIRDLISRLDIFRWGHAMVRPRVGFIWGGARKRAARAEGNILFAHSDLSGFSLFEEAQYRGVLAAERILTEFRVPFSSSL